MGTGFASNTDHQNQILLWKSSEHERKGLMYLFEKLLLMRNEVRLNLISEYIKTCKPFELLKIKEYKHGA